MMALMYLPPEETPADAEFVPLSVIKDRLAHEFPTFVSTKNIEMELGRSLRNMGYDYHKQSKGASYRVVERLCTSVKQVVLPH